MMEEDPVAIPVIERTSTDELLARLNHGPNLQTEHSLWYQGGVDLR